MGLFHARKRTETPVDAFVCALWATTHLRHRNVTAGNVRPSAAMYATPPPKKEIEVSLSVLTKIFCFFASCAKIGNNVKLWALPFVVWVELHTFAVLKLLMRLKVAGQKPAIFMPTNITEQP